MIQLVRVQLLIEQEKFDLAEKEIHTYLIDHPNDSSAFSLLAYALKGQNKTKEALKHAKKSVGLDPENSISLYVLSLCYLELENLKEARKSIQDALHLNPNDVDYLRTYSAILNGLNKNEEALKIINKALEIDPEDSSSKQIKSVIHRNLGQYQEADNIAKESIKDNPENAYAFAARGWSLLDTGRTKESLEHFKNAVLLEPNNEFAKSGLVMALKAQNKLFNLFYQFSIWMNGLSPKVKWALIIGLIILMRYVGRVDTSHVELKLFLNGVYYLYLSFVFLSWTINPIFNIMLRFNYYGKYALDKGQIVSSNIMAILLGAALIQFMLTYIVPAYPISGAIGSVFLMIPFSSAFNHWGHKSFKRNITYCILLVAVLFFSICCDLAGLKIGWTLYLMFLAGLIGYTWVVQLRK